jgi:hypothetical protein
MSDQFSSGITPAVRDLPNPAALNDAWIALMRAGRFSEAWLLSDANLRARRGVDCSHLPRHFQSIWDGTPLDGKRVLIRCYHGLGDTIHYIRYAPHIRKTAREVIVWAQPKLLNLLRTVRGIDRVLPLHDGAPQAEYDADIESTELPYYFRTTVDTIPASVPYLHAPAPAPAAQRFSAGLVWRGGDWDHSRSIPFTSLAPLTDVPVEWHVLQAGEGLDDCPPEFGRRPRDHSIDEMARVMCGLDLVITVDTMAAHLAGALGRPVWTMLKACADWRWMAGRRDTPWYPTMRLFRQEHAGDWAPVVAQVARELRSRIASACESATAAHLPVSPPVA